MDKVKATLRTLGVLLGLWLILAVVGLIAGVIPFGPRARVAAAEATAELDGGVASADAATSDEDLDAGAPSETAPTDPATDLANEVAPDPGAPGASVAEVTRWTLCASSTSEPSLTVGELFGDERPEIVVGCADGWHVIGLGVRGPERVAVLSAPEAPRDQRARLGRAAIGDVDGDAFPDLVLPLAFETTAGATRGGLLAWVPSSPYGGVREPQSLAPIAAVDAIVAPVDASPGGEILAVHRANALAQLPSEVWAFAGGPAPARRAALAAGLEGQAVRVADLDRDGHADVAVLSRDRVDLHFGDGAGAFPRTHRLELAGARELALGDLDGDGGVDLVVLGEGLRWIRGGAVEGMEPRGIDGVPTTLRGLAIVDVDGDGKLDLVGWDHPRLAVLRHQDELRFATETGLTLRGPFGPRRHWVGDLDHDGAVDDVVLLGTTASPTAPLELVLAPSALGGADLTPSDAPSDLPDAPLVIRAPLPN